MSSLAPIKRGDTFLLNCVYKVDGVPVSLAGATIRAQIRQSNGTLISSLTPALLSPASQFTLTPATATTSWPVDILFCDIEITVDSFIRTSETFQVPVLEDITR